MTRLEKLAEFEARLTGLDNEIKHARSNPDTTLSALGDLMKKADETAGEFNAWITTEFGFKPGPQIMPTILKTVLETTIDESRIIRAP
ncbi:MAG TPA: hypothetical protein VEF04_05665 [Blastocatellia bacterium]|nr:hypothetical protein [Blastocatellia bacterium]